MGAAAPDRDPAGYGIDPGATLLLYVYVPKGFFPVQDTGVIMGVSEAPQTISFAAMSQKQQELANVILKNPTSPACLRSSASMAPTSRRTAGASRST